MTKDYESNSDEENPLLGGPLKTDVKNKKTESTVHPYPFRATMLLMIITVFSNQTFSAINAILALYFNKWLQFSDGQSTALDSSYVFVTAIFAPLGGFLSDKFFGNYKTQCISLCLWTVGCILMIFTVVPSVIHLLGGVSSYGILFFAFAGLLFQGIGYGIVNPLQSVLVADQFHKSQAKEMATSFAIFYFFANVGSMVGESVGPILRQETSFEIAVVVFSISIGIASFLLIVTKPAYRKVPPQRKKLDTPKLTFSQSVWKNFYEIRHILMVWSPMPIYWALFYQQNSTWVFQAQKMHRDVGPIGLIPKVSIPPDLMPSLEDVFCLLLIFLFDRIVYPLCERLGHPLLPLRKIGIGFFFITMSFALAGIVQLAIDSVGDGKVSIAWQIPQIFCMAAAEITVAISGLDFAYSQSPANTRNTVTAIWALTSAVGNVVVIVISLIPFGSQATVFFSYAGMMMFVLLIFIPLAIRYKYRELEESTEENE